MVLNCKYLAYIIYSVNHICNFYAITGRHRLCENVKMFKLQFLLLSTVIYSARYVKMLERYDKQCFEEPVVKRGEGARS